MAQVLPAFPGIPEINGRILINGELRSQGFETIPVHSTCTTEPELKKIGTTPHVSVEILREAVQAASAAWGKGLGEWATAKMEERINAVMKFRNGMVQQRELICRLLMWEIGKTWIDSQAEFDRTIQYIDDTVDEVKNMEREAGRFHFSGGVMAQIRRAPLGVTLCMGPFNYPLNETFTTLIPALIMGNTAIVKVARYGQLLWDPLLEVFRDAFPKGVVNVINGLGREIVNPVVRDGKIDVLAFIGTSKVASQIKIAHPQPFRFRSILSLEAKNPAIIMEDADLDNAVSECAKGALSFNGQRCTALKMIFVHKKVASEFTKRLVQKIDSMKPGMPWDEGVAITPLPDPKKSEYLNSLINDAVAKGAELANKEKGGKIHDGIYFPAVLARVPLNSRIAIEEQFGPVVPIAEFEDYKEIEDYILNSPYGNQASVFGQDAQMLGVMIDRLSNQVCRININSQCQRGPDVYPFTGRKNSAEGTLSVYDALRSFSIRCMVAAKQDQASRQVIQGVLHQDSSNFLSMNVVL
ncbi:aldehyde dehydrogenase family protein [Bdellovibrio sp. GT3]|uniref:aldehyde dehydrogenase family protein n=1 Tax=Bdellovibrio sp. GT3 TaxID=3136282 RepID=UPI0030F13008